MALSEKLRIKLADKYVGDVRAWKTNTAAETLVVMYKDPTIDPDNNSVFVVNPRTGAKTFIGTTGMGKDGGESPFALRDGTIGFLDTEAPAPGDGGSMASLFLVLLNNSVGPEVVPPGNGTVDAAARAQLTAQQVQITSLIGRVAALEAKLAKVKGDL